MYKVLKIKWISALFLLPLAAGAQGIDEVLQSVGQHNKVLQALQSNAEAAKLEARTSNSLGDFSVQYSPFFMPDVHGVSSSELVVSQGFDFPTLYGARHKSNRLRGEAIDWQYAASRRDVLLQAKLLCLDLVRLNRKQALLAERTAAKKAKNYAEADRIRDALAAEGITIIDTPQGPKWKRQ